MNQQKKIKVLFKHRSMEMGGVEKVLLSMLNNLDKDKLDLNLCLNLDQGELRNAVPADIPTYRLAKGKEDFPENQILYKFNLIARGSKLWLFRRFPILPNTIMNNNADVEIATGYTMFSDVLESSNKKSKKIGWFHSDITFTKLQPIVPQILKQIQKFDYFFWGSQQAYDIFVQTYPHVILPPNEVIRNAIPFEEIKVNANEFIPDFKTEFPVFVAVGRLHSRKGHHKLLEAHSKLLKQGINHKIFVIGDGEERENLEKQIKQLKVEKTFVLLGSLTNPYPYVKHADFFIMPSESEGWPLIIAEALILKKPIIATNVGGISEMVSHKNNGYLVDYSIDSIQDGIKEFLTNPLLISTINKGLVNIEMEFNNQIIFDRVKQVITNLASNGNII